MPSHYKELPPGTTVYWPAVVERALPFTGMVQVRAVLEVPDSPYHHRRRPADLDPREVVLAVPDATGELVAKILAACKAARAFGSQGETHEGVSVSYLLDAAIADAEGGRP